MSEELLQLTAGTCPPNRNRKGRGQSDRTTTNWGFNDAWIGLVGVSVDLASSGACGRVGAPVAKNQSQTVEGSRQLRNLTAITQPLLSNTPVSNSETLSCFPGTPLGRKRRPPLSSLPPWAMCEIRLLSQGNEAVHSKVFAEK